MIPSRSLSYLTLLCTIAVFFSAAFYWRNVKYPPCCDVIFYGQAAATIQKQGFFGKRPDDPRNYGYQLFLSVVSDPAKLIPPAWGYFDPRVAIAQTALYLAAVLALFSVVYPASPPVAWSCAIGLLCNPFVLNYVPMRATEGLNASLLISIAAIVCALVLAKRGPLQSCLLIFLGGLVAGFALLVRPANLSIMLAWAAFALVHVRNVAEFRAASLTCAIAGLALPLALQIIVAATATNLGALQIAAGLSMLKYETNLSHIGPIALKYANPFIDPRDAAALSWRLYLLRPLEGIPTMVMHVFNSLDHNQLFSFVYDRNPWYRLPLNALNHAILAIAAMSLVSFFCERGRSNMEISRWTRPLSVSCSCRCSHSWHQQPVGTGNEIWASDLLRRRAALRMGRVPLVEREPACDGYRSAGSGGVCHCRTDLIRLGADARVRPPSDGTYS